MIWPSQDNQRGIKKLLKSWQHVELQNNLTLLTGATMIQNESLLVSKLIHLESRQRSVDGATMSRLRVFNDLVRPGTSEDPAGYVTAHLTRRQRSLLAKLRSGTLPLAIETGRYTRTPVDERLCRSCDSNAIETEFHFLFECDMYNDLREQFINTGDTGIRGINPPIEQLSLFFYDISQTKRLATFIKSALEIRTPWYT